MRAYIVKPEPVETLEVTIGADVYAVPLAGSLTLGDRKAFDFNTVEGTLDFFRKYIPDDVLEKLTQNEYNAVVAAWIDASKEAAGVSVGE